jgi:HEAT repeat protein
VSEVARDTPRTRIDAECERRGREVVVLELVELLSSGAVDDDFLEVLGGAHAVAVLAGRDGGLEGYWPRVWTVRGLLHVWVEEATPALLRAATDPAWRVREMVAKVVARHRVDAALEVVVALKEDPVPRVRRAAERALVSLASDVP